MMNGFGFGGCCGLGGWGGLGLVGGILNLVVTLGVLVGLVLLVVWAVRRLAPGAGKGQALANSAQLDQSPREILARRYASGEINREQYQQMLADLS